MSWLIKRHLGLCRPDSKGVRTYDSTETGKVLSDLMSHQKQATQLYQTSQSVILSNGDVCKVGTWVVIVCSRMAQRLGRVAEIIQELGSFNAQHSLPYKLLVQEAQILA